MVEVSNNFIQECEANVGTYKFGKIKVNYIDDNPLNYEQGAYSSSDGTKIDAEQSIRYNKLVECKPNFKYKIELGDSAYKMKIVTYTEAQAFIAAHDNLVDGNELTTEATAKYISVTIYSNDTLEGTSILLNSTIRNGEIAGAELEGNTTQNGTPTPDAPVEVNNVTGLQEITICGKNILYHSVTNRTLNGLTFTINDDKTVTVDGTATANTNVILGRRTLKANTNYYLSGCPSGGSSSTYNLQFYFAPTQLSDTGNGLLLNRSDDTTGMFRIQIMNGTVCNNLLFKPMLEQGTSATSYEPYQGKDYEIDLKGRNLLIQNRTTTVVSGVTFTINEDGSVTCNGTATDQYCVFDIGRNTGNILPSGTYIASGIQGTGSNETYRIAMWKNVNGTVTNINTILEGSKSFSLTENAEVFYRIIIANGYTAENLTFYPMIEQGSTSTDYTSYYNIELNKIGNYQDFIRKGSGKNKLFLEDKSSTTLNGITYSVQNGVITLSGTTTQGTTIWFDSNIEILNTLKGKKATLTRKIISGSWNFEFDISNKDAHYYWQITKGQTNQIAFQTKNVLDEITNKPHIYIGSGTSVDCSFIVQAEEGNSTYYEPFGYKDKWYIEKNVGKVVLNGSETIGEVNTGQPNTTRVGFWSLIPTEKAGKADSLPISNHFVGKIVWNIDEVGIYVNNRSIVFRADKTLIGTTSTEVKNWLTENNVKIYYQLSSPTYTLIENEELLNQLEAASHAQTQEGISNILVSGNLPATLKVTPDLTESIRGKQTTPIVGYNITGDDDLINFKITSKADSNGNILGATSQSQVDIEIFNENNTHNLENKQVYISTGLTETEGNYCKWQPFTITQTKDTQTKNHTTYTGYDDMMRGNEAYIDNINYGKDGITLYDFTCNLAKEMGMALGNTTMTNGDFIVRGNNFTNNETKLVVLKNVAQMVGGFAMIDRGNFLRIVELSPEDAMTPIELTTNLYTEDFQNSAKFGEINEIAIGETNLETNAIVRSDEEAIAKDGVKKIEILDNLFLGMLADKELAIDPLWDAFEGFNYYPFKTQYNGYPYIDLGDKLNITDINSNVYGTMVLNHVFEYNGGYKGNIGAEALSITAAKYQPKNTLGLQFRKVGIDINRIDGKITSEIEAATEDITKAYNSAIDQSATNINLSVTEINKVLSGDPAVEGDTGLTGTVNKISGTYLTVDSNDFVVVSKKAEEAQKKADAVDENTKKIVSQLKFNAETGLTISAEGSTDDDMKLNLTNSQVNFIYRNLPVLEINGNKIEFKGAFFQKFDLGNYVWQAEEDDSLSLLYEGDNN